MGKAASHMQSGRRIGLLGAVAIVACGACGGDSGTTTKRRRQTQGTRAATASAAVATKAAKELRTYRKVEVVLAEVCARTKFLDEPNKSKRELLCRRWVAEQTLVMRRGFKPSDFVADLTGAERRDPFRSFVVRQPGILGGDTGASGVTSTKRCTEQNMVAPNPLASDPRARAPYSLRDLRLVGIVLRGTRSYALFKDRGNFGHIVRRGNCLGKEKAKVTKIGAGYVRLELIPDVAAVGATSDDRNGPPIQKRSIKLYPEELPVDLGDSDRTSAPKPPAPAPAPAPAPR